MKRQLCFLALFAAIGFSLFACARSSNPSLDDFEGAGETGDFRVRLTLDRQTFRPGEAVVATVELANVSGKTLQAPDLNYNSLQFFYGSIEDDLRVRRWPVYSRDEEPVSLQRLASGKVEKRQFVLTRATESPGEFAMSVGYNPNVQTLVGLDEEAAKGSKAVSGAEPMAWSPPALYHVAGAPRFVRDAKGVLKKEEAVDLCLARLGKPASQIEADLIWNEAGFLDWWVCLTIAPESLGPGEPAKRAWFVNPYLGVVRSDAPAHLELLETRPAETTRVRDRRAIPPTGLPPRPGVEED